MSKISSVFVIGRPNTAYRPALITKYLLDRPDQYSMIYFDYGGLKSLPRLLQKILEIVFSTIGLLICRKIIVLPMQHMSDSAKYVYKVAAFLKKTIITDFYISMYETEVVDRAKYSVSSVEAYRLRNIDLEALRNSTALFFLNKSELSYYTKVLGAESSKPKAVICPLVVPNRKEAMLPYFRGQFDVPTITWWGKMGNPLHGFNVIAEAIKILVEQGFRANFAIFGANDHKYAESLEKYGDIAQFSNVLFSNKYSFNNGKLTDYLINATDIALGTFGDTQKAKTVLVNKVLDAASFGIPCVTQKSDGLLEYFEPESNILLSEPSSASLVERIRDLCSDSERMIRIGANARSLVKKVFSPERFEEILGDTILSTN